MKYLLDKNRCTKEDIYILCLRDHKEIGTICIFDDDINQPYKMDNKTYMNIPTNKSYRYCKGYLNPEINMDYEIVWDIDDKSWHWSKPISQKWKQTNTLVILRCYKLCAGTKISDGIEVTYNSNDVQFNITKTKEVSLSEDEMYVNIKDIENLPWKPHSIIRVTMDTFPSWFINNHKCIYNAINNVEYLTSHYDIIDFIIKLREEIFNKSNFTKNSINLIYDILNIFLCTDNGLAYDKDMFTAFKEIKYHQEHFLSNLQ